MSRPCSKCWKRSRPEANDPGTASRCGVPASHRRSTHDCRRCHSCVINNHPGPASDGPLTGHVQESTSLPFPWHPERTEIPAVDEWYRNSKETWKTVTTRLHRSAQYYKQQADHHRRLVSFCPRQWVWLSTWNLKRPPGFPGASALGTSNKQSSNTCEQLKRPGIKEALRLRPDANSCNGPSGLAASASLPCSSCSVCSTVPGSDHCVFFDHRVRIVCFVRFAPGKTHDLFLTPIVPCPSNLICKNKG